MDVFVIIDVGVFNGDKLVHAAPPAKFVPELIANLLEWYKQSEVHPLVKSAVFIMNLSLYIRLRTEMGVWAECGIRCYWVLGMKFFSGCRLRKL